jgi:heterodisulfide reductase subunit A
MRESKDVLVIGAGVAGATVAERLSRDGRQVHLIEKQDKIGGRVAEMGCKATDTCLRCNVCVANEVLRTVAATSNIHIHTRTELTRLEENSLRESTNGSRYTATLHHRPSFIDRQKCTGCMACIAACPEKCINVPQIPFSPLVPVIEYTSCRRSKGSECSVCKSVCPFGAIDFKENDSQSRIEVNSVVVAAGYEPYNPLENASYGYGKATNIISGVEAERQLATQHRITRPSDGEVPNRVAFVQCVGSRSEEAYLRAEDTDYCSAVCCSYALRMAQLLIHQNNESEVTIFYMDIQNFGKDFNRFYNKCKETMTFIRSRPYEIREGEKGGLLVKYTPQSATEETETGVCEQEFDLVILSVGIRPNPDVLRLAESLKVPIDEHGFLGFKGALPLPQMQRDGIYAVGACESPKDIASCIAQAEAVSAAIVNGGQY